MPEPVPDWMQIYDPAFVPPPPSTVPGLPDWIDGWGGAELLAQYWAITAPPPPEPPPESDPVATPVCKT